MIAIKGLTPKVVLGGRLNLYPTKATRGSIRSGIIRRPHNVKRGRRRPNLIWEESVKWDMKDWNIAAIQEEDQTRVVSPPVRYSVGAYRQEQPPQLPKEDHLCLQEDTCRQLPKGEGRFACGSGKYYADPEEEIVQATGMSESQPVNDVVTGTARDSTSMPEWWPAMQEEMATSGLRHLRRGDDARCLPWRLLHKPLPTILLFLRINVEKNDPSSPQPIMYHRSSERLVAT